MKTKTEQTDIKDLQEALRLAGKLAMAAKSVIESHVLNLSFRTENMQDALHEYNNYIFNLKNYES